MVDPLYSALRVAHCAAATAKPTVAEPSAGVAQTPTEASPEAPGARPTVRLGLRGPGVITMGWRGHSYELATRTPVLERYWSAWWSAF